MYKSIISLFFFQMTLFGFSQDKQFKLHVFDGTVVAGYVDQGAYLNFTGPNISWVNNNFKASLGMLPSLRFKQDTNAVRNSFVMPTLGAGITVSYKQLTFQIPFYYNPKTSVNNGRWMLGIGIGYRFIKQVKTQK